MLPKQVLLKPRVKANAETEVAAHVAKAKSTVIAATAVVIVPTDEAHSASVAFAVNTEVTFANAAEANDTRY